jgi:hypothetical protein
VKSVPYAGLAGSTNMSPRDTSTSKISIGEFSDSDLSNIEYGGNGAGDGGGSSRGRLESISEVGNVGLIMKSDN